MKKKLNFAANLFEFEIWNMARALWKPFYASWNIGISTYFSLLSAIHLHIYSVSSYLHILGFQTRPSFLTKPQKVLLLSTASGHFIISKYMYIFALCAATVVDTNILFMAPSMYPPASQAVTTYLILAPSALAFFCRRHSHLFLGFNSILFTIQELSEGSSDVLW